MKQIIALCLMLFAPLPVWAVPADMNLYLMLWPEGEENAPTATQVIEFDDGKINIFTSADAYADADLDNAVPATPAQIALLSAAVSAIIKSVSTEMGVEAPGHIIAVEWSVSNATTFARGSTNLPIDALPPEILAVQDQIFGARLAP